MKSAHNDRHQFALYYADLGSIKGGSVAFAIDCEIGHRLTHVLRVVIGDEIILFNRTNHAVCRILSRDARAIAIVIGDRVPNRISVPRITAMLPLLKRESFDEAADLLTQAGVTEIQPIITKKTQRAWNGDKEKERIERVMIAAAEQSKNFCVPVVNEPKAFHEVVKGLTDALLVVCEPGGKSLFKALEDIQQQAPSHVVVFVGPEGDFTSDEKTILTSHNALCVALTPTILRAQHAAFLIVGVLRSVLKT